MPHRCSCADPSSINAASSSECSSPPTAITRRSTSTTALTMSPNCASAMAARRARLVARRRISIVIVANIPWWPAKRQPVTGSRQDHRRVVSAWCQEWVSLAGYLTRIRRRSGWSEHDVAILDRSVIALQEDRPRRAFVRIERAARDPRNVAPADHLAAVEHHSHLPPDQRDVVRLPRPRGARDAHTRLEKAVDRAEPFGRHYSQRGIFDLHLVAAAQVNAAVAPRRIAKLDVQLEIGVLRIRLEICAGPGVRQYAGHHLPRILTRLRMPSREIAAVEQRHGRTPRHRTAAAQPRRPHAREPQACPVRIGDRARQAVARDRRLDPKIRTAVLPLRWNREPHRVARELDLRHRPRTPDDADESTHQRAVARLLHLEPGRQRASTVGELQIPAAHRGRARVLLS